jgi:hypothetical protein
MEVVGVEQGAAHEVRPQSPDIRVVVGPNHRWHSARQRPVFSAISRGSRFAFLALVPIDKSLLRLLLPLWGVALVAGFMTSAFR